MAIKSKAEHWRSRATEALAVAQGMTHPETKATMLRIAAGYEKMAKQAEEYEAALREIGDLEKPTKS